MRGVSPGGIARRTYRNEAAAPAWKAGRATRDSMMTAARGVEMEMDLFGQRDHRGASLQQSSGKPPKVCVAGTRDIPNGGNHVTVIGFPFLRIESPARLSPSLSIHTCPVRTTTLTVFTASVLSTFYPLSAFVWRCKSACDPFAARFT